MQAKSYKVVTILHFSKKVEGIRNFGEPASPRNPKKGHKKRAPRGSLQWRWGWGIIRAESQQKAIRGGQKAMTRFDDYLAEQVTRPGISGRMGGAPAGAGNRPSYDRRPAENWPDPKAAGRKDWYLPV